MKIDPNNTWRKVEERLKRETDPKRRRNLETVLAHMKAEAAGDLDGLMATLTDREVPHYHAYGTDDPILSPRGRDAVRQFYAAFVASGAVKLELDVQRLVADEDFVITEGLMKIAYPEVCCGSWGTPWTTPTPSTCSRHRCASSGRWTRTAR